MAIDWAMIGRLNNTRSDLTALMRGLAPRRANVWFCGEILGRLPRFSP